jgi:hypothetical protein
LSQIDRSTPTKYVFFPQHNVVHVDEKWFYVMPFKKGVRIFEGDEAELDAFSAPPHLHSKTDVLKVMFLVAVGRPQILEDGTPFDGKIGIWSFTTTVLAKNNSKNRKKGTPENKLVSVNAEVYREKITGEGGVIAKIKEKMSAKKGLDIIIQQDGAKPHTGHHNVALIDEAGHLDGWKISMVTQPPQSPDLNKLDLCFFWSLQKRADKLKWNAKTVDALVAAVQQAFTDYDAETLERCHGCLIADYMEVLKCKGGNDFRTPHSGVRKRQTDRKDVAALEIDSAEIYHLQQLVDDHFSHA